MDNGGGILAVNIPAYSLSVDEFGFVSFTARGPNFPAKEEEHWTEIDLYFTSPQSLDAHHHFNNRRHPGTGQWFLGSPELQTWINTPNSNLFCHGVPGVGKSVLMASVVDELCARANSDTTTAVACLYNAHGYDAANQDQGPLRWAQLLGQIIFAQRALPDAGSQPPFVLPLGARVFVQSGRVFDYLRRCLRRFRHVFFVLDGMQGLCPRCDPGSEQMGQLVAGMRAPGSTTAVNVLITSRSADAFRFQYLLGRLDVIPSALRRTMFATMEIRAPAEDVFMLLNTALGWLPPNPPAPNSLAERVKRLIWENCDGVFLVAYLYVQWVSYLWHNHRMTEIHQILGREHEPKPALLDGHPSDYGLRLYRQYRRSLFRMRECDDLALLNFARWVIGLLSSEAVPGIKDMELQMAWLSRQNAHRSDPVLMRLLRLCEGLLEVDAGRAAEGVIEVVLVHDSLKQYLKAQPLERCVGHWYEILRDQVNGQ